MGVGFGGGGGGGPAETRNVMVENFTASSDGEMPRKEPLRRFDSTRMVRVLKPAASRVSLVSL